jgi:hypothetical protein
MTTTNLFIDDKSLERRFIVGTLALDSNLTLAAEARVLLDIEESVSDCAQFTADFRRLMGPVTD